MKFKASGFEDKYNDFWNEEVVKPFNKIKRHSTVTGKTAPENEPTLGGLMKQYCAGVSNIVKNLNRQKVNFTDQVYIAAYLEQIKKSALADLQQFKVLFKNSKPIVEQVEESVKFLNKFNFNVAADGGPMNDVENAMSKDEFNELLSQAGITLPAEETSESR